MCIAGLFIIAKLWKQPSGLSIGEWNNFNSDITRQNNII